MTNRILMFSGKFCAPCKIAKPVVCDFCEKNNIHLDYHLVEDCDERILDEYEITAVPTFYAYNSENATLTLLGWNKDTMHKLYEHFKISEN